MSTPKIEMAGVDEGLRQRTMCCAASICRSSRAESLVIIGGSGTGKSVMR